jgi:diguanylate cyclase (GGDEF)-like protein/PAS domain S-box-containing protein
MQAKILRVNKAFTQITGYMEQDVLGEDPKFLSSGRQPRSFYQNMWQELNETGRFEGEIWNRRKNGEIYPEHQTITAIRDINGNITHYVSVFSDITKQKRQEEKAKHLAFYDPLTMLPNRSLLVDRIEKELAFIKRFNRIGCLISIDIDRFDDVNKTFGYQNGDHFLIHIAERIKSYLRATDTVARLGANHFAIMLPVEDIDTETMKKQINVIIDKLLYYLSDPFEIDGTSVAIQISMGVTIIDNTFNRVSDVLRQNDLALIQAKSKEGNSVHLSEP